MNCNQCWPNGGPEPPNTWFRSSIPCVENNLYSRDELNMRRKAEVLQYKSNSIKWTKKQTISYLSKNPIGINKRRATPTQQMLFNYGVYTPPLPSTDCSNYNGIYMLSNGDDGTILCNPSTSDVPTTNFDLYYDIKVPLTNWKSQRKFTIAGPKNIPMNKLSCLGKIVPA